MQKRHAEGEAGRLQRRSQYQRGLRVRMREAKSGRVRGALIVTRGSKAGGWPAPTKDALHKPVSRAPTICCLTAGEHDTCLTSPCVYLAACAKYTICHRGERAAECSPRRSGMQIAPANHVSAHCDLSVCEATAPHFIVRLDSDSDTYSC